MMKVDGLHLRHLQDQQWGQMAEEGEPAAAQPMYKLQFIFPKPVAPLNDTLQELAKEEDRDRERDSYSSAVSSPSHYSASTSSSKFASLFSNESDGDREQSITLTSPNSSSHFFNSAANDPFNLLTGESGDTLTLHLNNLSESEIANSRHNLSHLANLSTSISDTLYPSYSGLLPSYTSPVRYSSSTHTTNSSSELLNGHFNGTNSSTNSESSDLLHLFTGNDVIMSVLGHLKHDPDAHFTTSTFSHNHSKRDDDLWSGELSNVYNESGGNYIDNMGNMSQYELLLGPVRDPLSTVIPMTIVYSLIFVTGVLGNVITCSVIARNKYMHTATNYYLFSLAISDLLLLLLGLPSELYTLWQRYPYAFGETFCIIRGERIVT